MLTVVPSILYSNMGLARLPAQLGRNAGGRGPDAEERREEGTYSSECEYAAHRDDKAKEVEDQVRATT